jgi:hypothetical protein
MSFKSDYLVYKPILEYLAVPLFQHIEYIVQKVDSKSVFIAQTNRITSIRYISSIITNLITNEEVMTVEVTQSTTSTSTISQLISITTPEICNNETHVTLSDNICMSRESLIVRSIIISFLFIISFFNRSLLSTY